MTYEEIHPAVRSYIGCFEGYRKLGFRADDIYFETSLTIDARILLVFCTLKTQGMTFRVGVSYVAKHDAEVVEKALREASRAVAAREVSGSDLDRIWQESLPFRDGAGFVVALTEKGFQFPNSGVRNPFAPEVS